MNRLRIILDGVLDALFPPLCVSCRAPLSTIEEKSDCLCSLCLSSVTIHGHFWRYNERKSGIFILGAAMAYESETAKRIIHSLKYEGYYLLSRPIAKLMSEYLKSSGLLDAIGISGFILVPIPLHPSRLKERGYNQSALISRELGAKTGMPVYDVLSRKRKTKEQAEIKDTKERLKNVSGCFVLRKNEDVKGKNTLLVDDVFTSGATMFEAARVLYRAGAAKVFGLAAAKA